jgi:APA family basic amino acid/polyamine antiporter
LSGRLAQLFTGLKLLAIAAIIIIGISFGDVEYFHQQLRAVNPDKGLLQAMLLALVGVFWSFGGWHHATYLSGETKEPKRTVPRAMILGTMTVTVVYLLANIAFMNLLPGQAMATSERVAGDALATVFGFGGKAVAIAIIISIIGTISIYTMTAPRIYYSMAKDGIFFQKLAELHPTFRTPYIAMLFQAVWAILLLLVWGSFTKLITFVTFMDIVFMALAAASIFIFRARASKEEDVPFKLSWYPIIPILYVLVTVAFVFNTMISLNKESFAGIFILLMGIPVYYFFKKKSKPGKDLKKETGS